MYSSEHFSGFGIYLFIILFSSLCVVVSEFGRNMKFNHKKNRTAERGLPMLTELVCMQLNILV